MAATAQSFRQVTLPARRQAPRGWVEPFGDAVLPTSVWKRSVPRWVMIPIATLFLLFMGFILIGGFG